MDRLLAYFDVQVRGVRLNSFPRGECPWWMAVTFRWDCNNRYDDCCVEVRVSEPSSRLLGHVARGGAGVMLSVLLRDPYQIVG